MEPISYKSFFVGQNIYRTDKSMAHASYLIIYPIKN